MRYLIPLLLLLVTSCATVRKADYLKAFGAEWACNHNQERMECVNINSQSRFNPNRPNNPGEL